MKWAMSAGINLFYCKVSSLKFNFCALNHVFKHSRTVCQVVDKQSFARCLEGRAGDLESTLPPPGPWILAEFSSRALVLASGRKRQHWIGWRWPPGSKNPGNIDWKRRSTLGRGGAGFLVIELSGQIWNVHMAQAESHTHLGPGILSHATLLLATGPCSVPFLKEEGVPILAWSEHRHFRSWSKKQTWFIFWECNNQGSDWAGGGGESATDRIKREFKSTQKELI